MALMIHSFTDRRVIKKKIPNEKEQVIELEFYLSKFAFANGAEHTNIRNP